MEIFVERIGFMRSIFLFLRKIEICIKNNYFARIYY